MAIQKTRWKPDTCDCVIDYVWNDQDPEDNTTHVVSNINKCAVHSTLATNNAVWDAIKVENPRKNHAIKEILDRAPASLFDLDTDGVTRKFKKGIDVNFSFTGVAPNRLITINVTGVTLTTNQKNNIQTFLNNRFGVGKVTLVNG